MPAADYAGWLFARLLLLFVSCWGHGALVGARCRSIINISTIKFSPPACGVMRVILAASFYCVAHFYSIYLLVRKAKHLRGCDEIFVLRRGRINHSQGLILPPARAVACLPAI